MLLQELYVNAKDQRKYILFAAKFIAEKGKLQSVQELLNNVVYFNWNREKKRISDVLKDINISDSAAVAKRLSLIANDGDELLPKRLVTKLQELQNAS